MSKLLILICFFYYKMISQLYYCFNKSIIILILLIFLHISLQSKRMEIKMLTPKRQYRTKTEQSKIKQINNYIQNRIMPVFGPLQIQLLQNRPVNIKDYCIEWLKNYHYNSSQTAKQIVSDEEPDEVFHQKRRRKLKGKLKVRKGISGDSTRDFQNMMKIKGQNSQKQSDSWPEQTKGNLMLHLKKCIFFEHLNNESLLDLIEKIRLRYIEAGEVIIKEGENGNNLFIVQDGRFSCEKEGVPDILKQYKQGQIFGQIALLYNHPRATTITALTQGKLFELDRQEFNSVLRSKWIRKFRQCEVLLEKIEFFKDLDIYEKTKLFEVLQEKIVGPQKFIIKQGQVGNCFYIVAEGQLVAYKRKNEQNKLVYAYKRGDYFGQIALLKNIPRQASIKTLTQVRLYFINRDSFVRTIGPLEGILSRSCQRYTIWGGELSGEGQS